MRAIVLALGLISIPAVAADQFDLVCTAKKSVVRYHIDLTAGEWCDGNCRNVQKIVEVTSGKIVLERTEKTRPRDKESVTEVNRQSGEWYTYMFDPVFDVVPLSRTGACQAAEFIAFPKRQF